MEKGKERAFASGLRLRLSCLNLSGTMMSNGRWPRRNCRRWQYPFGGGATRRHRHRALAARAYAVIRLPLKNARALEATRAAIDELQNSQAPIMLFLKACRRSECRSGPSQRRRGSRLVARRRIRRPRTASLVSTLFSQTAPLVVASDGSS